MHSLYSSHAVREKYCLDVGLLCVQRETLLALQLVCQMKTLQLQLCSVQRE